MKSNQKEMSANQWSKAPSNTKKSVKFPLFGGKRVVPGVKGMRTLLEYHGVDLQLETLEQLWAFHQLLRENNEDQDLTRLNAFESMVERHYADCILPCALLPNWPSRMIDVGSGAGFPGIPLKLVQPQIHLTLCEPRPKRVAFLEMVIQKLGLKNIDVFGHKVTSNSMHIPVDGMISRAFELMEKTVPRLQNALKPGGRAIFLKGPAGQQELASFSHPEYTVQESHFYQIPNSTQERSLIVLTRKL
jgi:16S rRNA (guanine527-N7)-methyltransferase